MRTAEITRKTNETDIRLSLDLDGQGKSRVRTGVGFLDHMLTLLARHGGMDLELTCDGDTQVDDHHSVEDIGIALGQAFDQALGEKRGVRRYYEELAIPTEKIGSFDTQLVYEFMWAFAANARLTLHLRKLAGRNSHHIVEGAFKALGRALREAAETDPRFRDEIPSTKGML